MTATQIMLVAVAAGVIGRWAHNEKALPAAQNVIEVLFVLILIAALDTGRTQSIARGFALLFLAAVLLSNNSPINAVSAATQQVAQPPLKK